MNTATLQNECISSDTRCHGLVATVQRLREHLVYMRSGQAITVDPEADSLVCLEVGQPGYNEAIAQYCESLEADIKWATTKLKRLGCSAQCLTR